MTKPLNHHGENPALSHLSRSLQRSILTNEARLRRDSAWGTWELVSQDEMARHLGNMTGWVRDVRTVYRNAVFSVLLRSDTAGVTHVGVSSLSGVRPTWYEMQRIKNELFGAHSTGIEIYPPERDVTDGADMFHLWILPGEIPFGLTKLNASCGATTPVGELLLKARV